MMKRFVLIIVALSACSAGFAAFEDSVPGARVHAMAGAYTAVADDVNGILYQPAALAGMSNAQLGISYGRMYLGLSDDSTIADGAMLVGVPLHPRISVGAAYQALSLNAMYTEQTQALGFAAVLGHGLRMGVAAKLLSVQYGSDGYTALDPVFARGSRKSGFDADAGLAWSVSRCVTVAYARRNMVGIDLGLAETAPVAGRDQVGISYRETGFILTVEGQQQQSYARTLLGIEKILIGRLLAVRAGMGWGNREYRKITTGFGLNFEQFSLDYAFEYPVSGIENTNGTQYVSFVARFGRGPREEVCVPSQSSEAICKPAVEIESRPVPQAPGAEPVPAVSVPTVGVVAAPPLAVPVSSVSVSTASIVTDGITGSILQSMQQDQVLSTATVLTVVPLSSAATVAILETQVSTAASVIPVVPATTPAPAPLAVKPVVRTPGVPSAETDLLPRPTGSPARYTAVHKTAAGESLPSLAEKYYGNRSRWTDIYEANKDKIEKGSLQPGHILIIP